MKNSKPAIPTQAEFAGALNSLPKPKGRQPKFLRTHSRSRGRALTATRLAKSAGYKDYRGVNLHYGLLAAQIGAALGSRDRGLSLLVDFPEPKSVTNKEWVLVMHPQFAEALEIAGWI